MGKSSKTKTCKKCKAEVDPKSKVCSSCGAPMKMKLWKKALVGIGGFFALVIVIGIMNPSPSTVSTAAPETKTAVVEKTQEQIATEKADAEVKAKADADAKVISDKVAADAKIAYDKANAEADAKAAEAKAKSDAEAKAKADADAKVKAAAAAAKAQALVPKVIAYKELARNPEAYMGTMVKFTGQVGQVQEENGMVMLLVSVTKGTYGYTDTIALGYDKSLVSGRILEDDIVSFTAESKGLLTYETVRGDDLTIPQMLGKSVTRQ